VIIGGGVLRKPGDIFKNATQLGCIPECGSVALPSRPYYPFSGFVLSNVRIRLTRLSEANRLEAKLIPWIEATRGRSPEKVEVSPDYE